MIKYRRKTINQNAVFNDSHWLRNPEIISKKFNFRSADPTRQNRDPTRGSIRPVGNSERLTWDIQYKLSWPRHQCSNYTKWRGVRLHLPWNLYGWGAWMCGGQIAFIWRNGGKLKKCGCRGVELPPRYPQQFDNCPSSPGLMLGLVQTWIVLFWDAILRGISATNLAHHSVHVFSLRSRDDCGCWETDQARISGTCPLVLSRALESHGPNCKDSCTWSSYVLANLKKRISEKTGDARDSVFLFQLKSQYR